MSVVEVIYNAGNSKLINASQNNRLSFRGRVAEPGIQGAMFPGIAACQFSSIDSGFTTFVAPRNDKGSAKPFIAHLFLWKSKAHR